MIRVVGRNLAEGAGAAIGAGVMLLGGMYASWTALALFLGPLLVGALIGAVFYGAPGQRRIAALEGMAILAIFAWS
ncbi:hypothetical protein KJ605_02390, partial [Patescibacteria group bacterium]|nr:hypothetical protein [Patescibacteria group bacterium]